MHPVLFHISGFPVPSYGFLLALSFLAGVGLAVWGARRRELDPLAMLDVGIWIIVGAVIGARLYYVLLHFDGFRGDVLSVVNPFQKDRPGIGGLVSSGGFIGGILAAFLYLKIRGLPFPKYVDAIAPSVALGVCLTRIGCFLNGCCFGTGWDGPLAVSFPQGSAAGRFQEQVQVAGLHPSQLYESFGGLVILVLVLTAGPDWRRRDGLQFYMVIVLYAVLRFMVEFTRHYGAEEMFGPVTHNQVVCLVLFSLFGVLALRTFATGTGRVLA